MIYAVSLGSIEVTQKKGKKCKISVYLALSQAFAILHFLPFFFQPALF